MRRFCLERNAWHALSVSSLRRKKSSIVSIDPTFGTVLFDAGDGEIPSHRSMFPDSFSESNLAREGSLKTTRYTVPERTPSGSQRFASYQIGGPTNRPGRLRTGPSILTISTGSRGSQ